MPADPLFHSIIDKTPSTLKYGVHGVIFLSVVSVADSVKRRRASFSNNTVCIGGKSFFHSATEFAKLFFVWTFGEETVWFENIFNRFITLCFVLKDSSINSCVSGSPCQDLCCTVGFITSPASSPPFLILEINHGPNFQCKWLWYQPLMIQVTSLQTLGASNDDNAFDLYATFHS